MAGMGLSEFLGHDTKGGGGSFLRGWRKRQPPAVNVFLHTRASIVALWQHNWPRIHEFEDRETGEQRREVWGGTWNCLEAEDVLRRQYKIADDGSRESPPRVCPLCLLIDWVRTAIIDEKIGIAETLFVFEVNGDREHARVLTAGGIANLYNNEEILTEQMKRDMAKARVRPSEAWKENAYSKCNYLFRVVDADHPEAGVQIAIETTLLGDKVKDVIRDQMTSAGDEDGNPILKPYCIRWEHRPSAKEFNKKYHAIAMRKVALTDDIRRLIVEEDPPDVSRIIAPGNVATLRAGLERYATPTAKKAIPWDAIFGPAEKLAGPGGEIEGRPTADDVAKGKIEPETVACDRCNEPMLETDAVCSHCGAEYEVEEPAPPPPPMRTRSQAKKGAAEAQKKSNGDDDIPF